MAKTPKDDDDPSGLRDFAKKIDVQDGDDAAPAEPDEPEGSTLEEEPECRGIAPSLLQSSRLAPAQT